VFIEELQDGIELSVLTATIGFRFASVHLRKCVALLAFYLRFTSVCSPMVFVINYRGYIGIMALNLNLHGLGTLVE